MRSSSARTSATAFASSIFRALRKADARSFRAAVCSLTDPRRSIATALRA